MGIQGEFQAWKITLRWITVALAALAIGACGGSDGDGNSSSSSAGGSSSSSAGSSSSSSAQSREIDTQLRFDPLTRLVSGGLTASDFDLVGAAHIHQAATAGGTGGIIVDLEMGATTDEWNVPAGTRLTEEQATAYLSGLLYFMAHESNGAGGFTGVGAREDITPRTVDISQLSINGTTGEVTGFVTTSGFEAVEPAAGVGGLHIHENYAGANGGITVTFEQDATDPNRWNAPATGNTVTVTDLNNGKYYINAHSTEFPAGQARAQILPSGVQAIGVPISPDEIVGTAAPTAGTATGYVTLNETSGFAFGVLELHTLEVSELNNPNGAHIHRGEAGVAGGVVVGFDMGTLQTGETTLSTADRDLMLAGETYFNLHEVGTGTTVARGQVLPAGVEMVRVVLSEDEADDGLANGSATSTGIEALGYITVVRASGDFKANLNIAGVTPTLAHIHERPDSATINGPVAFTLVSAGQAQCNAEGFCSVAGTLDATQLTKFDDGLLYFAVHSGAGNPVVLRGQIQP